MEITVRENTLVVKVKVSEKKPWIRVIHDQKRSDFLTTTQTRSAKGALIVKAEIEGDHIIQVFNGSEKAYFELKNGVVNTINAWELSKYLPVAPEKIKITLEFDPQQKDLIEEILKKVAK